MEIVSFVVWLAKGLGWAGGLTLAGGIAEFLGIVYVAEDVTTPGEWRITASGWGQWALAPVVRATRKMGFLRPKAQSVTVGGISASASANRLRPEFPAQPNRTVD